MDTFSQFGEFQGSLSQKNINRTPIILQHGLLDDSWTWFMLKGKRSLPFILVEDGYDVWFPNIRGNMFKDLYSEYKNYKPASLTPRSERENALLNLDQMHFAMHEANLYLDVYPNDANMMKNYVEFRNNYNKLLQEYQQKYGAINVNSDYLENVPFGWEEEIWPWNRRDS